MEDQWVYEFIIELNGKFLISIFFGMAIMAYKDRFFWMVLMDVSMDLVVSSKMGL